MAISSGWAGPPVEWAWPPLEWAGLPVSPTLPYLRVSKVCLMRTGRIRQTEKTGQGRGMENGRRAAILLSVGHLQLITTLKRAADCCQLCQYKLTKPNLTYPNPEK